MIHLFKIRMMYLQAEYFILEMDKPDINKASLVPRALTDIITCRDKCEVRRVFFVEKTSFILIFFSSGKSKSSEG